jgi:hypothetical protein
MCSSFCDRANLLISLQCTSYTNNYQFRWEVLAMSFQQVSQSVTQWVSMSMLVFWVVTPCGLVGRYQRFEGTYSLHLQN